MGSFIRQTNALERSMSRVGIARCHTETAITRAARLRRAADTRKSRRHNPSIYVKGEC